MTEEGREIAEARKESEVEHGCSGACRLFVCVTTEGKKILGLPVRFEIRLE